MYRGRPRSQPLLFEGLVAVAARHRHNAGAGKHCRRSRAVDHAGIATFSNLEQFVAALQRECATAWVIEIADAVDGFHTMGLPRCSQLFKAMAEVIHTHTILIGMHADGASSHAAQCSEEYEIGWGRAEDDIAGVDDGFGQQVKKLIAAGCKQHAIRRHTVIGPGRIVPIDDCMTQLVEAGSRSILQRFAKDVKDRLPRY